MKCFPSILYDKFKASTSLGNVQWKLAKQMKDSDFKNIFHNATVTVNLLGIFENAYRNVFDI